MKVFVDTSAFVALVNRSDQNHGRAQEFFAGLKPADRLHTSNFILDETITRLRMTAGHRAALEFAEATYQSPLYAIHTIERVLEKKALEIFKKFRDKKLSFTDCTSFSLMRNMVLTEAFAFDEDFAAMGFRCLP